MCGHPRQDHDKTYFYCTGQVGPLEQKNGYVEYRLCRCTCLRAALGEGEM